MKRGTTGCLVAPRALLYLLGAVAILSLTGCGDFVNSLRRESREVDAQAERDRDDGTDVADQVQTKHARSLHGLSANNVADYQDPSAHARAYGKRAAGRAAMLPDAAADDSQQEYHRVTRDDFVDKAQNENSLWDGQGQNNYLFSNNRRRETGDVVTADVEKELRREIQYQLWMNLPPEQRRLRRKPAMDAATDSVANAAAAPQKDANGNPIPPGPKPPQGAEEKAKDAAAEAAKQNMGPTAPGDDVIRMEVVENMGNGLMRVLGQKRVVYRGVSRIVEVAALVNNKDIDDNNHTKSGTFLDMKAQVIQ